jgi:hypothetical protein
MTNQSFQLAFTAKVPILLKHTAPPPPPHTHTRFEAPLNIIHETPPKHQSSDQKAGMSVEANVAFPERISSPPPPQWVLCRLACSSRRGAQGFLGSREWHCTVLHTTQLQVKKRGVAPPALMLSAEGVCFCPFICFPN